MDVTDWQRFLQSGQRSERLVGRLPAYLNGFLMASSRDVRMGHEYAVKAIEKHGLEVAHLPIIGLALKDGEVLHDRVRHLTFLYWSPDFSRWFQVTIKCCTERRRLFVTTFHGLGADDVKRKRKRYQTVWPIT